MSSAPPLIVHVIHHLVTGGLENGLVNLINKLPRGRFRHAVLCVEDYSEFRQRIEHPDVEVIALHRSRIGVWQMRWQIFRLCRRLRPAVLHSRNQSGLDALLPARLAGVPRCIHGEHGWDVDNLTGEKWKPAMLRRLHAPLVSCYITVSEDLRRFLMARVGIAGRRIRQVYNGVDVARFMPRPDGARTRLPEGVGEAGNLVFGTVGRLQPVKDQATLLRAFALLAGRQDAGAPLRARLAIVGDGPLAQPLKALAQELGIAHLVWFSGQASDVPAILREFDVFVLPSLSEGISNTILEAMASGLPVLATAVGGNVELIRDQVTGGWFAPGDVAGLAALMQAYLDQPARRRQHGQAARDDVLQRFSLDVMLANYAAVYDAVIGRPPET